MNRTPPNGRLNLLAELHAEADWRAQAECRSYADLFGEEVVSSWFFPERGASTRQAREICADCPVQPRCPDYAIRASELHGVWGGLVERERRTLRRDHRIAS